MSRLSAALLGVALLAGAPTLAQEGSGSPAPSPAPSAPTGRRPFEREQGSADKLAAELKELLAELGKRYPDLPFPPQAASPTPTPAPTRAVPLPQPGPDLKPAERDPLLARLQALRPTRKVLLDVLTPEGILEIGKAVWREGKKRFERPDARALATELGLHPSLSEIKVYQATTEELLTMELGTVSAREFAAGLRGVAQHLQPRYRFYAVTLDRPEAEKQKAPLPGDRRDPADCRLQLFVYSQGGWAYLGPIWRLPQED